MGVSYLRTFTIAGSVVALSSFEYSAPAVERIAQHPHTSEPTVGARVVWVVAAAEDEVGFLDDLPQNSLPLPLQYGHVGDEQQMFHVKHLVGVGQDGGELLAVLLLAARLGDRRGGHLAPELRHRDQDLFLHKQSE